MAGSAVTPGLPARLGGNTEGKLPLAPASGSQLARIHGQRQPPRHMRRAPSAPCTSAGASVASSNSPERSLQLGAGTGCWTTDMTTVGAAHALAWCRRSPLPFARHHAQCEPAALGPTPPLPTIGRHAPDGPPTTDVQQRPRPLRPHPHGGSRVAILWDKNAEYFFKINKLKLNTPHPSLTCYGHGLAYSGD